MKSSVALLLCLTCISGRLFAQSLYEVSLAEKSNRSTLIVEGKVIGQVSFWNEQRTLIYTSNKIEVYKIFKGILAASTIEIMTEGGSVGTEAIQVSEILKLVKNQIGTFFLYPNSLGIKSPVSAEILWEVYGSAQGFINYDLNTETGSAPFARYKSISKDFYNDLKTRTKRNFENRNPSFSVTAIAGKKKSSREQMVLAPSVTSFSPALVTAGALLDPANNVLTISGTGFGTASGLAAVLFDNADDGVGGTPTYVFYNDPLIISWTATQIQLRVPSTAGTGALQVQDPSGLVTTAPGTLDVLYSIQDASFSVGPSNYTKEVNLVNANGLGGYTVYYSNNTAGSGINLDADPAKQTFQRALTTWKETAGFNVIEGGTTSSQSSTAGDGVSTIMFDNLNTGRAPLPAGVLAVCYNYMTTCSASYLVNQIQKNEFDIVIRSTGVSAGSTAFTAGPCPPNSSNYLNLDLETVILHELGHAINLGHIIDNQQGSSVGRINPNKLMNFAISNSLRRTSPDFSAKAGALYTITQQGAVTGSCIAGPGEMIPLSTIQETKDNCPASFPVTPTAAGTSIPFDLVHAGSNRFVDPAYTQVRCDGFGASVTNNAYYAFRTNPAGGILSLVVSGYTPVPAALTSCSMLYAGVPVTGIRLGLYQVSSCPTAGSFPAPVSCQIFSGNGVLSNISGLAANANYLMFLEGVENTKASFTLTIAGTALPVGIDGFTGELRERYNQLNWSIDYPYDVRQLVLEKSGDGTNYISIDSTEGNRLSPEGIYQDNRPYAGKNFYRLAIINKDGSRQYSSIVLLVRNDQFLAAVYPNPASGILTAEISTAKPGKYSFELYSSTGQLTRHQAYEIVSPKQLVRIPINGLANGSYYLKISNDQHEPVQNMTVMIRQ